MALYKSDYYYYIIILTAGMQMPVIVLCDISLL